MDTTTEVCWLDLPDHILSVVAKKLIIKDYTRFGAVCRSWQAVYLENRDSRDLILREPVLLMLATQDTQTRSLYSFSQNRVYDFPVSIPHSKYCPGASHGWVVTVSEDFDIRIVNPLLSVDSAIQLPPLTTFKLVRNEEEDRYEEVLNDCTYLQKAVLSADPVSNPNYMVMAIHGSAYKRLSFFKPGNKAWSLIDATTAETDLNEEELRGFNDIIFDGNTFYSVDSWGTVYVCDLNGLRPKISELIPLECHVHGKKYLVKSSTNLLLVVRHFENSEQRSYRTFKFTVVKFDPDLREWKELKSLGGQILFVGASSSLLISVSDMPGYKPNCIYFTYDNYDVIKFHDMGVFDMEDGSIQPHYATESGRIMVPAPIFIQPTVPN